MAPGALVEEDASIDGHALQRSEAAERTSYDGLEDRRRFHGVPSNPNPREQRSSKPFPKGCAVFASLHVSIKRCAELDSPSNCPVKIADYSIDET